VVAAWRGIYVGGVTYGRERRRGLAKRTKRERPGGGGSVDGAHLVLKSRLQPHPARSTNYRRGRSLRPRCTFVVAAAGRWLAAGAAAAAVVTTTDEVHACREASRCKYRKRRKKRRRWSCTGAAAAAAAAVHLRRLTGGNHTPKPKRNSGYYAQNPLLARLH